MNAQIAIVGGGASGLMAAAAAAESGARVVLLERLDRVGKKLLATGNGRCNLTHVRIGPENYHGAPAEFIQTVLDQCTLTRTLEIFEKMGLAWRNETDSGRIYPRSGQASSVLDVLRRACARLGVTEICGAGITRIDRDPGGFSLKWKDGNALTAQKVILATGGRAAPGLGSNGSGYDLARQAGHRIVSPFPALTGLVLDAPFTKRLKGVRCEASLSILDGGKILRTEAGEIQFTEDGLSGIPALGMARSVHEIRSAGDNASIRINLFPERSADQVSAHLTARFRIPGDVSVGDALVSLIHKRLIPVILKASGVDSGRPCSGLPRSGLESLVMTLTDWRIPVRGTRSWNDAQVTAGGVAADEIRPQTLESTLRPGLFFAGELIDVDGDCGGYNLQWAWSSGRVAGTHAARS